MTSRDEVITQLLTEEKVLTEKLEKLRKPIIQVEQDLEHIRGTISFLTRHAEGKFTPLNEGIVVEVANVFPLSRLKGLTHSAAVVAIAKHNGGIVRAQDAKRLMIRAGIMSQTKNSTNMTHNAILRTDKFERVAPGEYRLKEASLKLEVGDTMHVPN